MAGTKTRSKFWQPGKLGREPISKGRRRFKDPFKIICHGRALFQKSSVRFSICLRALQLQKIAPLS
jgi:hypothetical protein